MFFCSLFMFYICRCLLLKVLFQTFSSSFLFEDDHAHDDHGRTESRREPQHRPGILANEKMASNLSGNFVPEFF